MWNQGEDEAECFRFGSGVASDKGDGKVQVPPQPIFQRNQSWTQNSLERPQPQQLTKVWLYPFPRTVYANVCSRQLLRHDRRPTRRLQCRTRVLEENPACRTPRDGGIMGRHTEGYRDKNNAGLDSLVSLRILQPDVAHGGQAVAKLHGLLPCIIHVSRYAGRTILRSIHSTSLQLDLLPSGHRTRNRCPRLACEAP